jgi:hypothetical protein
MVWSFRATGDRNPLPGESGPKPGACVERSQLRQRLARHRSRIIGRPIHRIIVNDDGVTIAAEVYIQLDLVHPQVESQVKGRKHVLRGVG